MRLRALFLVFASFAFGSCGLSEKLVDTVPTPPDYSQLHYWAAHPEIIDLSDTSFTGAPLSQFDIPVFYVSPTVYFPKKGGSWNADPLEADFRDRFQTPIEFQSTAFNVAGPIYAPYYRQAAYQVYTTPPSTASSNAYTLAYNDVRLAFDEFLSEIPNGSPFILASHSQGSHHLVKLVKETFDRELLNRVVAAYLVGIEINACEFPLPLGENPAQTGCLLSWRTYKEGAEISSKFPVECVAITNPLTWTTTTQKVLPTDVEMMGGLIKLDRGLQWDVATAQIHAGVVWSELPKIPGARFLRTKNYHRGDINLYYGSIQQNVLARSLSYLKERR